MEEYISREMLLAEINGEENARADQLMREWYSDMVKRMPSAKDVVPVRHARWHRPYISGTKRLNPYCFCTWCGQPVKPKKVTNYCPNCGAKMDFWRADHDLGKNQTEENA